MTHKKTFAFAPKGNPLLHPAENTETAYIQPPFGQGTERALSFAKFCNNIRCFSSFRNDFQSQSRNIRHLLKGNTAVYNVPRAQYGAGAFSLSDRPFILLL